MKTKLVLWGSNAQNERLLIALELLVDDNKVKVFTFPERIATEDFSQLMMKEWRDGNAVEFPDGFSVEERDLTMSGSLLPDGLKAERDDVVQRAQTEWQFIVLSTKLFQSYKSELAEFTDRVAKAVKFEGGTWDELKNFWEKVQNQVRERNLFREHADALRDGTNELFGQLKGLRNRLDAEFDTLSKNNFEQFTKLLEELEKKVADGFRLAPLFDELREMQRKIRDAKFTKEHRNKIWDRLDAAFKLVKNKRGGGGDASASSSPGAENSRGGDEGSGSERLGRRYEGLLQAIGKMRQSIQRDEDDLEFQKRKVATTDGQLEAQIRQAKIIMIEERLRSKQEKLNEMTQTQAELDKKLESIREKEARREKMGEAKKAAEQKIAEDIKKASESRKDDDEKLKKAAEQLGAKNEEKAEEKAGDSLIEAVTNIVGDSLEDAIDTAKAVSEVVGEKVADFLEDVKEAIEKATVAEPKAEAPEAEVPTEDAPVAEAPAEEAAAADDTTEAGQQDSEDDDKKDA
jgi:hypothetical protein